MSDRWIMVIPTAPSFVPSEPDAARAVALLRRFAPPGYGGVAARAVDEGRVEFVDAGSNGAAIGCPSCGADLDVAWWQEEMTSAHASEFRDLAVRTPCCAASTSLNDLAYDWPQGFARWRLEVMNPTVPTLTRDQLATLSTTLAHDVRPVYRRL